MTRLFVIVPLVVVGLYVFAFVDLALTNRARVRAFPKLAWAFVIVLPIVGALLWFIFGKARFDGGGVRRAVAPDDDPTFLANLRRDEEQDERIRRLEQELADLDDDPTKD
ncbi:MAG: PLDc_N domain-containing protein [Salinibacterium sp.]|nr:PLDc_N domain-containing protein [Salinibacterium sp.]